MSIGASIAIYYVIWWTVLFAVLPWGVRSQLETGEVVEGTEPGAPVSPRLLRVVLVNTAVSTLIFVIFYYVYTRQLISLDDIPFLPFGPGDI